MSPSTPVELRLPHFTGPLDLLLHLVEQNKISICEINISEITAQYLEYLKLMKEFNIELAADFLKMAATLLFIKSREILPVNQNKSFSWAEDDLDELYSDDLSANEMDNLDSEKKLIQALEEYRKIKLMKNHLHQLEDFTQSLGFRDCTAEMDINHLLAETDLPGLLDIFESLFNPAEVQEIRKIILTPHSTDEKIKLIMELLARTSEIEFFKIIKNREDRLEVVVSFLALLELIRQRRILVDQQDAFSEISLKLKPKGV